MAEHSFYIEDLGAFLSSLEARKFVLSEQDGINTYSKTISNALTKHYSYSTQPDVEPVQIRVTYDMINSGKNLRKMVRHLKWLNLRYRQTLPGFKTKRDTAKNVREHRWEEMQKFLDTHRELISCFKYEADNRLTEGNFSFNLMVATTPKEQQICIEFIRAITESHIPHGLFRRHREADRPVQQRNGWIKRYALIHKKRGWSPSEIAHEIQKELRNGTWDERSRLQYNIANTTICKIAGLKISHHNYN